MNGNRRAVGVRGGITAGLIAGAVLAAFMLLVNILSGQNVWVGFKFPAVPFLGQEILRPGFEAGPVVLGVLSHFAVSAVWGLLFGLCCIGLSRGATVLAGAAWGLLVWLAMYYLVLPLVGMGALAKGSPVGMAILNHLVFGLSLGLAFLPYQRRVPRAGEPRQATV